MGFLMLSCMSWLYILEINPLLVISFANIFFSYSIDCLFILLMISFALQNILCIIRYNLFIFAFIFFPLKDRLKNITTIYVKACSYMFSFRSYNPFPSSLNKLCHWLCYANDQLYLLCSLWMLLKVHIFHLC